MAAALGALADAGIALTPELAARTAIVMAVSDGGVVYTRRFYEQIVKQGANAASPLLFPETVYNAPTSHLAAQLGLDGAYYTLVGDSTVGLAALKMAEQLLALGGVDRCVVVACEEVDWILCEAYRDWRLSGDAACRGSRARLSLTRDASLGVRTHAGVPFFRRRDAGAALDRVLAELVHDGPIDLVAGSCANGTSSSPPRGSTRCAHGYLRASAPAIFPRRTLGERRPARARLASSSRRRMAVRSGRCRARAGAGRGIQPAGQRHVRRARCATP